MTIVQSLVDSPASVFIAEEETPESTTYTIYTEPGEAGQVIGKRGKIASALRTIVTGAAKKHKKNVHIEIVE